MGCSTLTRTRVEAWSVFLSDMMRFPALQLLLCHRTLSKLREANQNCSFADYTALHDGWQCPYGNPVLCRVRTMHGHRARVGTMAWSSHLLSSGSRDRNILQRDIRTPEDFQQKLLGHRSEVCTSQHGIRSVTCQQRSSMLGPLFFCRRVLV